MHSYYAPYAGMIQIRLMGRGNTRLSARRFGLPLSWSSIFQPKQIVNSFLSRECSIFTIKMICDGLGITLVEFFSTPEFDTLEQEIQ